MESTEKHGCAQLRFCLSCLVRGIPYRSEADIVARTIANYLIDAVPCAAFEQPP
jgi:hypothetical protein